MADFNITQEITARREAELAQQRESIEAFREENPLAALVIEDALTFLLTVGTAGLGLAGRGATTTVKLANAANAAAKAGTVTRVAHQLNSKAVSEVFTKFGQQRGNAMIKRALDKKALDALTKPGFWSKHASAVGLGTAVTSAFAILGFFAAEAGGVQQASEVPESSGILAAAIAKQVEAGDKTPEQGLAELGELRGVADIGKGFVESSRVNPLLPSTFGPAAGAKVELGGTAMRIAEERIRAAGGKIPPGESAKISAETNREAFEEQIVAPRILGALSPEQRLGEVRAQVFDTGAQIAHDRLLAQERAIEIEAAKKEEFKQKKLKALAPATETPKETETQALARIASAGAAAAAAPPKKKKKAGTP